jgi:hypothetical protein
VSRPLARYTPSRRYVFLTLFAFCGALFSAWTGLRWTPCWVAAALFALSAAVLAVVTLRPRIEIHQTHLVIGRRAIAWRDVRQVDQTGWSSPLAVYLTLPGRERVLLVYPGDPESCRSLLRHVQRFSREALLDGVPYRVFWGEPPVLSAGNDSAAKQLAPRDRADEQAAPPLRYPVLRAEDEDEVERLFQRLKSVGHLESKNSEDN